MNKILIALCVTFFTHAPFEFLPRTSGYNLDIDNNLKQSLETFAKYGTFTQSEIFEKIETIKKIIFGVVLELYKKYNLQDIGQNIEFARQILNYFDLSRCTENEIVVFNLALHIISELNAQDIMKIADSILKYSIEKMQKDLIETQIQLEITKQKLTASKTECLMLKLTH